MKVGWLIEERRIFRRAVFVMDRQDQVIYAQYMPTLGDEPYYDERLAAARIALG